MQWHGISEFVAVAETNSFTLAAKKLALSTAQVSRQINALEKRLGIKLLYRTTRHVSLTDEGQIYYHNCKHVLDGLENAELAISQRHNQLTGKIKMTAPVNYGELKIVPLVNQFLVENPNMQIELELTNTRLDLTEHGLDLAIRLGSLENSSLMAKRLTKRRLYLCASTHYIKQFGEPKTISQLAEHNCLLGTLEHWRFMDSDKSINLKVKGRLRCNSGFALVEAALNHLGIVQLPDYYLKQHIQSGRLQSLLNEYQKPDDGVWAVYPNNRYLSNKLKILVDYLQQGLTR
ncbi:LysR family transcriptional regulator [Catenovulum sp. 2E275]|uniref:LysR family transcriptional regulator n=1 Tax=Catenovulum sp. 2E275 TaxID=2980497 RepID=UPI0021CDF55D|nr:LysR family transcriptional regulator [Catenovulum sp. 2E275]MCU4676390.1 LysR family transcriptional regulator [Catenovulum sp. 2E275]